MKGLKTRSRLCIAYIINHMPDRDFLTSELPKDYRTVLHTLVSRDYVSSYPPDRKTRRYRLNDSGKAYAVRYALDELEAV